MKQLYAGSNIKETIVSVPEKQPKNLRQDYVDYLLANGFNSKNIEATGTAVLFELVLSHIKETRTNKEIGEILRERMA